MKTVLTRQEVVELPEWEEIEKFLNDPAMKGRSCNLCTFLQARSIWSMFVDESGIHIVAKSIYSYEWDEIREYKLDDKAKENYDFACEIITKLWNDEVKRYDL